MLEEIVEAGAFERVFWAPEAEREKLGELGELLTEIEFEIARAEQDAKSSEH